MADFIRRHSVLFSSLLLLILSFQLMSASIDHRWLPQLGGRVINAILSPVQEIHHHSLQSIRHLWRHYIWLIDLETERGELLRRIKALEAQNSRLIEFENENKRLGSLLRFSEETRLGGVAATVVGRDPSNWISTITVNRGLRDGVLPGLPVVDGNAIVGQTTVVSTDSSKILLLTDHTSAAHAIVQSSRAPGIVEGIADDKLRLRYVLKQYKVNPGDRVIASGMGGIFPKGTLIGVVTRVNRSGSGLFQNVELLPSVDLNRLENVLILVSSQKTTTDKKLPVGKELDRKENKDRG